MKKKGVLLLGATGSIGKSTQAVLKNLKDEFYTVGVVANNSIDELAKCASELNAKYAITTSEKNLNSLKNLANGKFECKATMEEVIKLATSPEVDVVVCAIVGIAGLLPVIAAIKANKRIALASKEVMVMAGDLVNKILKESSSSKIVPVDSEHSAIYQCLLGRESSEVKKLWLTASGGAFRDWNFEDLHKATLSDATKHPIWSMGRKITIDSASLMNKALELVEAHYLFNIAQEKLEVVLHPQSLVHSMVELVDNSFIAQMSQPNMQFAIQYALTAPNRIATNLPAMDFSQMVKMEFVLPDKKKYPSLDIAYNAISSGGSMPAVMNAANEVAVDKFIEGKIKFIDIWKIVEKTMEKHSVKTNYSLDDILEIDSWAREYANGIIKR